MPADMPPLLTKNLQSFLGIMNYLGRFSAVTAEVCKPLQGLTSMKADWTWNRMFQELYEKVEAIIMDDSCMKLCNEKETSIIM